VLLNEISKMHAQATIISMSNALKQAVPDPEKTARFVSDRHFGIGADGLILIAPYRIGRSAHDHV
jgi:diaminopimelate epimerase